LFEKFVLIGVFVTIDGGSVDVFIALEQFYQISIAESLQIMIPDSLF
jgi:hypothetical protein